MIRSAYVNNEQCLTFEAERKRVLETRPSIRHLLSPPNVHRMRRIRARQSWLTVAEEWEKLHTIIEQSSPAIFALI